MLTKDSDPQHIAEYGEHMHRQRERDDQLQAKAVAEDLAAFTAGVEALVGPRITELEQKLAAALQELEQLRTRVAQFGAEQAADRYAASIVTAASAARGAFVMGGVATDGPKMCGVAAAEGDDR